MARLGLEACYSKKVKVTAIITIHNTEDTQWCSEVIEPNKAWQQRV